MQPLTIRIREDTKESLDKEADEYGVSVSEYVRELIEKGREYDELEDQLQSREERIQELERQLSKRSQIEKKIEDLPDVIRDTESYQERRQRLLDNATVTQRLKWKVTGVPVDEIEDKEN
jgi:antitoxin component of RelBE/YafQ-DinJ toxin-antitoxin module